jgi:hypothetical protein
MPSPRRTLLALLALGVLAGAAASPLHAKDIAVAVEGGYFDMTIAKSSAKAVFGGSAGGATFGAELQLTFDKGIFAAAGFRRFSKNGQRVFVADKAGAVFPLGHPLEVRLTPLYAAVGYRLGRLGPFFRIGLGAVPPVPRGEPVAGVTESEGQQAHAQPAGAPVRPPLASLRPRCLHSTVPDTIGRRRLPRLRRERRRGRQRRASDPDRAR